MSLYNLLVRLYPASFRNEYGGHMRAMFRERRAEAGAFGALPLWIGTVFEVLGNATLVHLDILKQDLAYTRRMLARAPGFAITAIAIVALGIGATTAAFSVTDFVLIRPLPFPDPGRLVKVWEKTPGYGRMELSAPNYRDWKAAAKSFASMGIYYDRAVTMLTAGEPTRLAGTSVSADVLPTLGVSPVVGRAFSPDDDRAGAPATIILSYSLWQSQFGADPNILGRNLVVDSESYSVIGVMPPLFHFPASDSLFWVTNRFTERNYQDRTDNWLEAVARLRPGVTLEQARAEMDAIAASLLRQFPDQNANVPAADVRTEVDRLLGPMRDAVLLLWGTVALVLLIACANVSNLLVARTADRQREFDVRLALGGSRGRIVRQLIVENLLLGACSSLAGIVVAYGALQMMTPLSDIVPRIGEVSIDARVLIFAALVAIVTTMAVTLAPALRLLREGRSTPLLTVARTSTEGRHRLRRAVVVGQVAVSLVLLSGATLLVSGLGQVLDRDPGFDADHLMAFDVSLPGAQYDADRRIQFFAQLIERVEALPAVRRATAAMPLPLAGHEVGISFTIEGRSTASRGRPTSDMAIVSPGYFSTIGTPLLSGRDFTEMDDHRHPRVVIVNQAFADKFFPGESVLGKRIQSGATGPHDDDTPMREIVGIAGNAQQSPIAFGPDPIYYLPFRQMPWGATMIVRAEVPPKTLVPALRLAASEMDAEVAVHGERTFDEARERGIAAPRLPTIVRVVAGEAMLLVATGLAIGGAGVLAADVLLRSRLPQVGPPAPILLLVACCVILLTALSSSIVPARRAASVNPTEALRSE
jgi:predicted permease